MSVMLGSFTYPNAAGYSDPVALRVWYTGCRGQQFIDVDGGAVACGSADNLYIDIPCTLAGTTITIPATELPTTDDSQTSSVLATAQFFVAGAPRDFLFEGWVITSTLGASLTFDRLWTFNLQVTPAYTLNPSYLTSPQVAALIAFAVGLLAKASTSPTYGLVALSTTPDDSSDPIALGINDPIIAALPSGAVPRSDGTQVPVPSQITDDGTDVGIQTINKVQLGDYGDFQNGSYIDVDDTAGRADLFAEADGGNEYAGVAARAEVGTAEVFLQTTGYTHVYGTHELTALGDALFEHNGTQVRIDDDAQMVMQRAKNAVPNDAQLATEQICFYLDEGVDKLMVRVRYSDGSLKTGEVALV